MDCYPLFPSLCLLLVMFAFDHSNYATVFFIPNAYAINNTEAIGGLATTVDLGSPFFVQKYQHDPEPPKSESEPNLYVNHTNDGIINGNLSVVHVGNDTETLEIITQSISKVTIV